VKVANSDQVACDGACKDTRFTIDDEEFVLDFFITLGLNQGTHELLAG
jgi:hypothetical protein